MSQYMFSQEERTKLQGFTFTPPQRVSKKGTQARKNAPLVVKALNEMIENPSLKRGGTTFQSWEVEQLLQQMGHGDAFKPKSGAKDDLGGRRTIADCCNFLKLEVARKGGPGGNQYVLPSEAIDEAYFTTKGIPVPEAA
jgi:hypothetical protein